jgi:hypothetical protein
VNLGLHQREEEGELGNVMRHMWRHQLWTRHRSGGAQAAQLLVAFWSECISDLIKQLACIRSLASYEDW